ncbi:LisH domain-containing protein armc9, partial [Borealophlyctis nickersoniae]
MASDCAGREYLLSCDGKELIQVLVENMKQEERDTIYRQNLLGALQKLSLRRTAQSTMNTLHLIPYLLTLLSDLDGLSEYTIQYGTALFMNLCLRTAGKKACCELVDPERTLKVLMELSECENLQVKTYVNGTLYSILSDPTLREHARAIGLGDMLQYLRGVSDEGLVRQIDFVIEQLNAEETPDISDTVSEDGEEEDFEEEEEDQDATDEEDTDDLTPQGDEVAGDALLVRMYGTAQLQHGGGRGGGNPKPPITHPRKE